MRNRGSSEKQPGKERRQEGQIIVEGAIVLPLFLFLVFGTLEVGKMWFRQVQVDYATFMATRVAVVNSGGYIQQALQHISANLDSQLVNVYPIYDPEDDYLWLTLNYRGRGTWPTVRILPDHDFPLIGVAGLPMGSDRNRHIPYKYAGQDSFPKLNGGKVPATQYEFSQKVAQYALWESQGRGTGNLGNGQIRRWRPPDNRLMPMAGGGWASYAWRVNSALATSWPNETYNSGFFQRWMQLAVRSPFILAFFWYRPELVSALFSQVYMTNVITEPMLLGALMGWGSVNPYAAYPLARGSMGAVYGKNTPAYGNFFWTYYWFGKPPVAVPTSWGSPMPWQYQTYAWGNNGGSSMFIASGVGGTRCKVQCGKDCCVWDNDLPGVITGMGWVRTRAPGNEWQFYWATWANGQVVELLNNAADHPYTYNIGSGWSDLMYFYDQGWAGQNPWAPGQGEWDVGMGCLDDNRCSNPVIRLRRISHYDAHLRVTDEKAHGFHWGYREPRNDHSSAAPGWSH